MSKQYCRRTGGPNTIPAETRRSIRLSGLLRAAAPRLPGVDLDTETRLYREELSDGDGPKAGE